MEPLRVQPDPSDPRLTRRVAGLDHTGAPVETSVTVERPLTLYLNGQEIVTMMTILDRPRELALGYLLNQGMLRRGDEVTAVDYDDDLQVVVVRTGARTDFEEKLKKKTLTSGCAQGTAFGDLMEDFAAVRLAPDAQLRTSWLYRLLHRINTLPSLYLEAGAIHGCALCVEDQPVAYMEDVGRHNAVDKIAGWMFRNGETGGDKIFYTTGRLTSEMVIKVSQMGIPVLLSRSGATQMGLDMARQSGVTLISRAKGKHFLVLNGVENVEFDRKPADSE
jgi:FdhD protein